MGKYKVEQISAVFGNLTGEVYRRALGFQMQNIIDRIDAQMEEILP
jgi:hypothetical protein